MGSRERFYETVKAVYGFLPVQLLFLHFRKYQMLLVFWIILIATITGNFAEVFGASTLFLSPEYLGDINFFSMLLLGGAMAMFIMAWQITTFIIHSHRIPFMGATRHSFLKYCINNSLLPLAFLIFYSVVSVRFQWFNEHADTTKILRYQVGFYLGLIFVFILSFAYFFRVDRDLLKVVLSRITNPARIRHIIPYDTLDFDVDIVRADTYLSGRLKIKRCADLEPYHPRLLNTVLRKHHRNATTAIIFAIIVLLLSGAFMEDPRLRIPAGGGFLILFSVIMGILGAVKHFLRSWEILGWLCIMLLLSLLAKREMFDLRSIAYGLDYKTDSLQPQYNYNNLKAVFNPARYERDLKQEEKRLDNWLQKTDSTADHPLIVISVSGGGSRAAYWTFNTLQYLDSMSQGRLFKNTVLITGASGGMIGAAYWREVHNSYYEKRIPNPYDRKYQDNIGKDLLNAIIFSFATVDLVSPFNNISIAGYSYTKDRGYAMEQELIRNTEGMLDKKIGDYREREANGDIPAMVFSNTIVNDGRKLLVAAQPVSYLTQPAYALEDSLHPPLDAIDFATFFKDQNPHNLRVATALRMNATFPFILPVVKLPSQPGMNIMDAGMRDNFGIEIATRYLFTMRDWIERNNKEVVLLEIRDTREHEVFPNSDMNSFTDMILGPLFVIQHKWEPFQSYTQSYLKDFAPNFLNDRLHCISMQYIPKEREEAAALNFHLTRKEKSDIINSIYNVENQRGAQAFLETMNKPDPIVNFAPAQ
jgi:hypothetical protein